jgi:NADH-quinone oxidoreductase subunit N
MGAYALMAPEAVLLVSAIVALFADVLLPRSDGAAAWIGAVGCAIAAGLSVALGTGPVAAFAGQLSIDGAAQVVRTATALLSAVFLLWLAGAGLRHGRVREFTALVLFAVLGSMLMSAARDWVVLVLSLETATMPAYVLMGFDRKDDRSLEGALKYFLLSMVASVVLLYGLSFVIGMSASTSYAMTHLSAGPVAIVAAAFVVAGMLAKLAAVPFQWWAPDAYAGAPAASVAFVSSVPKIAALVAFARIVSVLGPQAPGLALVIAGAAVASMLLGNLAAYPQQDLRRLMAYSGVAHAGYLLVGLATQSASGLRAAVIYAIAYTVPSMGVMLIVAAVGNRLDDFRGLAARRPWLAWTMTLLLLSLIGVPPLAGFIGKLYLFTAAIASGFVALSLVGVLMSVLSAGFYLRIVRAMFLSEPVGSANGTRTAPASVIAIAATVLATIAVGVASAPLLSTIAFTLR